MKHRLTFLLLLLIIGIGCQAQAPITPQKHSQLRAAMDRHDLATAEQILRECQSKSPQAFLKNNYDYLFARVLDRRGNVKEAHAAYQKVIARNSIFTGYALGHLAELARAVGNARGEQNYLSQMLTKFPAQLNAESARKRLGTSYFKSNNYVQAITTLQPISGLSSSLARESTARIGEAQLALKQTATARSTFESLLNGGKDDASLRAVLGLDKIDTEIQTSISEVEHLRRARILQFNRAFAEARPHWLAIINGTPTNPNRAEAAYETGRGYQWEEQFRDAAKYFQMAYDIAPKSEEGEQGFYYVGHCHQYLNDADKAIARYSEFLQLFPRSKFVGYAYLNAIDSLRAVGKNAEALTWAQRTQTENRDPFIQVTGLFQQARIHLSQENYVSALADFTALKSRNLSVRGLVAGTNLSEVNFMRAYCLEKLGRLEEAITEYLTFPEGRNEARGYYGQRATARLQALMSNQRATRIIATKLSSFLIAAREAHQQGNAATAKAAANQALRLVSDDTTRKEMLDILRAAYAKLPSYSRVPTYSLTPAGRANVLSDQEPAATGNDTRTLANELLFLGLYDEGAPALVLSGLVSDAYSLAVYAERGDYANRGQNLIEPQFNGTPDDYRPELMPRTTAELLFPNPYHDAMQKHAVPRNVNPFFVLAIARQESRFDAKVKSFAAARGLLQFISSTSSAIAKQLNLSDFEQDDLYNPNQAILIGSQYMQNLFDELKHPANVAAAYNGSEQSVRRWVARSKSDDIDRHVIEIGKRETKDYVYKVMNNLWAYQALYR
ncbi:MAG: transglycosylase SLT domain-containing protein [Blastocatellia bacterium]|nr:transglycosylase SLT domain-containing protein [Blastocatellia bacterium]